MPISARPSCQSAERLRKSGRNRHHRGLVQQAVDRLSGPVDQPGLAVGADQRRQRRADDGADAQCDDAGDSEPARQRRDGHQRFRHHGEQRDGPDRVHQQPAAEQRQDRRGDGVAAGSARPVHHSTVESDGHQNGRQRPQPGDGIHQLRRATGRHRGCAAELQSAGHDDAQHAVQSYRSDQEQRRHHHHQFSAWRQLRSGVDQLDPFGQDRRLSRIARQHAGEGAGAGRPVRGVDGERAVGQDDRRHSRARVGPAAGRLRSRSHGIAVGQRHARHLQGQHHRRHAQSLDRARRRSERAAAEQYRDARSER